MQTSGGEEPKVPGAEPITQERPVSLAPVNSLPFSAARRSLHMQPPYMNASKAVSCWTLCHTVNRTYLGHAPRLLACNVRQACNLHVL